MKLIRFIAMLLMVVGAINWGLWGLFQFDIVKALFPYRGSNVSTIAAIVYIVVGLAGIYGISFLFKNHCTKEHK
ncbi:MAG: hypothetical protein K1060chlam5_00435 [Candidatus Anoxychlamydiales bacterium]|nr:hypothetical protein [Candidatus Anoxychlamydiales bacterium]